MTKNKLAALFNEYTRTVIETYPTEGRTPSEIGLLNDLFRLGWSLHTCTPDQRKFWSCLRPEIGQDLVTALVVRDACGSRVVSSVIPGHGAHYFNLIGIGSDRQVIDFTRSRFPPGTIIPMGVETDSETLLVSPNAISDKTEPRFRLLRRRIEKQMRDSLNQDVQKSNTRRVR